MTRFNWWVWPLALGISAITLHSLFVALSVTYDGRIGQPQPFGPWAGLMLVAGPFLGPIGGWISYEQRIKVDSRAAHWALALGVAMGILALVVAFVLMATVVANRFEAI